MKIFHLNKSKDEKRLFCHFNRLWCLKESYIKYIGFGIGFKLARLNFCINTDEFDENNHEQILSDTKLELDNKVLPLRFDEQVIYLSDNEQQIITVCLTEKHNVQPFIELTIEEILKGCSPLNENEQADNKWWKNFEKKKEK